MKPKVFIARPIAKEVESYIAEHCEYEKWEREESIPRAELLERIHDVEGIITAGTLIDSELLEHAPHLKVVSNMSVGYNNFDISAMRERGVLGTHTPSVLDDTVADLVLGLMLSAARRLPELDHFVKEGKWIGGNDRHLYGRDVHHAKLGIIGMGRIGEAIVQRAKYGFDMDVVYYNRRPKPEIEEKYGIRYAPFDDLLKESDFIVLMTPLTPETTHLIGKREFGLMKETAIFINASRGQTVDEQAMIDALQNHQIYAAGLDVFQQEPVNPNNPLLKLANVVTLPHIGSATERTRFEMAMTAAKNLVAGVSGEKPLYVVQELKSLSE